MGLHDIRDHSFFMGKGGLVGLRGGGMPKNWPERGGPAKKILSVKGGHSKNYPKML